MKKLIIFGDSSFAEIAYEYFTNDSEYQICAFTIEEKYIQRTSLFNLPIVPFENIIEKYNPKEFCMFIALTYNKLNKTRERIFKESIHMGYSLATYISTKAFVWHNVKIGRNCFIFEDNTIQPFVEIGDNNIFWSGNHIGHHSIIGDNNFISSHVVISGHTIIGNNCFLGVNSTFVNNLKISDETVTGAGAVIIKNTKTNSIYVGNPAKKIKKTSRERFEV
jgi:sugar O-acyltransferase (sialic acid O-acetyltransferase NeuD family)